MVCPVAGQDGPALPTTKGTAADGEEIARVALSGEPAFRSALGGGGEQEAAVSFCVALFWASLLR